MLADWLSRRSEIERVAQSMLGNALPQRDL
jgi:hypothetical protein